MEKINVYSYPYHWSLQGFWQYGYEAPFRYFKKFLEKKDLVLDIGCGDGKLTALLAPHVKKVVGLDHQQFPLDMAQVLLEGNGITNVEFVQCDAVALDFKENTFDKITCFDMIEHIPQKDAEVLVQNIIRILKPGGWLCLTTPNRKDLTNRIFGNQLIEKHYHEYTVEELQNLFAPFFTHLTFYGSYLPLIPVPKIEHYANVLPFRIVFNKMVDLGKNRPRFAKTLILIAQKK